ncbi:hypothetical protein E2C01_045209 [Portunus trituberculatus]|uniref:Uncharacterized protein n=1 Tax=Portunus trituberculatus TaxID=210409 RepID=A0A5B7G1D0_PORTR|nr:hypothetical protein [Portunus trituberculatus]
MAALPSIVPLLEVSVAVSTSLTFIFPPAIHSTDRHAESLACVHIYQGKSNKQDLVAFVVLPYWVRVRGVH